MAWSNVRVAQMDIFFLEDVARGGRSGWRRVSRWCYFPQKLHHSAAAAASGNKLGNKLFQGFTFWHTMRGAGHTSCFTRRRQIGQLIFEAMTGTFQIRRPPRGHFCRFLCDAVHLLKRNRMKMIFYDCFAKLHKYTIKTVTRVLLWCTFGCHSKECVFWHFSKFDTKNTQSGRIQMHQQFIAVAANVVSLWNDCNF